MWPIDIFLRSEKGGYSSGTSVPPLIMEVTPRGANILCFLNRIAYQIAFAFEVCEKKD